MKILAIDTSTNVATAAVTDGNKLIGEYTVNNKKKTHSQKVMVMIDTVLKDAELDIHDIDLFAVSVGPGSFTGLRIGVATMKSLAHACDKPIIGVSSLEALAYNLPFCEHIIVPVMDAGKDRVYAASYIYDDGFREIGEPEAMTIDECIESCGDLVYTAFVGDGVTAHKEYIREKLGDNAYFAPANANEQRAASVACCAYEKFRQGIRCHYTEVNPVYLKKSQAERELEERKNKQ